MKAHNGLTDDNGQEWEFLYEEKILSLEGKVPSSEIINFKYCKKGGTYTSLPSWATVDDEWKVTLGFFDQDEETGEIVCYWKVSS